MIDEPPELSCGLPVAIFQIQAFHDPRIPTPYLFFFAKGTNALVFSKVWAVPTEIINTISNLYQVVFIRDQYFPGLSTYALKFVSSIRRLDTEKSQA